MKIQAFLRLVGEISKMGILRMNLVTFSFGFFLEGVSIFSVPSFLGGLGGTALASAGAASLNNYLERQIDAKMERTKNRAIPSDRVNATTVLLYGVLVSALGVGILNHYCNTLTAFLAFLTLFFYILIYTPLKRVTWLNTYVGAIPGAIIPLAGWAAASGKVALGGWSLFFILFFWQLPHFFALAWMHKEDYKKAGFKMLSLTDTDGSKTVFQIFFHTVALVVCSVIPVAIGILNMVYLAGVLAAGGWFFWKGIEFSKDRTKERARSVFIASVIYLPILLVLILVDQVVYSLINI